MIKLKVTDMKVSYRKFSVSGITFSLKSGDIFGLVGRSGSGKSAVLRNLICLERQGKKNISVTFDGNEVDPKKVVGYSPQDNSLYNHLTIKENLEIFGRLNGIKEKDIKSRAENLLRRLDLYNHKDKKISEISGGMQKRADLAVTLINDPAIVVLDEPFNGLDISIQSFFWDYLIELSRRDKIIIISSHILSDIQKYCNQLGLIQEGKFYFTAAIREALKSSRTRSLQDYLEKLFTMEFTKER